MKELRFAALGDSLTYGYGVLEHIAYPARLADELPKKCPEIQWKIYNCGVNGDTTRDAKARLSHDVLRHKPHLCAVFLGANDSALNEGQYRTPWEYEQNMCTIIEQLLATEHGDTFHNGTCLPILLTPPPVVDTDFYPFTTTDRIEWYRDIVLRLAKQYTLPMIDVFSAFWKIKEEQGFDAYDALFQFDGVHWSNAGYALIYPLIEKMILELTKDF